MKALILIWIVLSVSLFACARKETGNHPVPTKVSEHNIKPGAGTELKNNLAAAEKQNGRASSEYSDALILLGNYYEFSGNYAEAEGAFLDALKIKKELKGDFKAAIAAIKQRLGNIEYKIGKFEESERYRNEALEMMKEIYGDESPEPARLLSSLAENYIKRDEFDKALSLVKKAGEIQEKTIGPDHPDLAVSLDILGTLYNHRGEYADAKKAHIRAISIIEKTLGPDNDLLSSFLTNLGEIYIKEGQPDMAAALDERALKIREKNLRAGHPELADVLFKLSEAYIRQKRYDEAERLLKRAGGLIENSLGGGHPVLKDIYNDLAEVYYSRGQADKAIKYKEKALNIAKESFGESHTAYAGCMDSLAETYFKKGEPQKAEDLYRRSLAIKEKACGPDSPETVPTLVGLACLCKDTGRLDDSENLAMCCISIYKKNSRTDSAPALNVINLLGEIYLKKKEYRKALGVYEKLLPARKKIYGGEHLLVAEDMGKLATCYNESGDLYAAEKLMGQSQAILEKKLGPDNPDVAHILYSRAEVLRYMGKLKESKNLQERALAIKEKMPGMNDEQLLNDISNLVEIYFRTREKPEKIEALLKRKLAVIEKKEGKDSPQARDLLLRLSQLYAVSGRFKDSLSVSDRVLEIYESMPGADKAVIANIYHHKAYMLRKMGKPDEAKVMEEKSKSLGGPRNMPRPDGIR